MSTIPKLNGQLEKPKAVFFDWDGTLVDSLAFLTNAHNHVRRSMGIKPDLSKDEFHYYLGMPRDIIFKELYGAQSKEGEAGFVTYYNEHNLEKIQLIEDAEKLLQTLFDCEIILGLVSNKRGNFLRDEVRHLGWDKYFEDRIIGSGDTDQDKPSAVPLQYALSLMDQKFDNSDIWYIGDTDIDIKCANNAGVISILYSPKAINISAVHSQNVDKNMYLRIKKYEEIYGFLLQTL